MEVMGYIHQSLILHLHYWQEREGAHNTTAEEPNHYCKLVTLHEIDSVDQGPKGGEDKTRREHLSMEITENLKFFV